MDFVDVSAKTVDEAITKACIQLGVSSDRLDIQVISEGSSGFLGFGSKPAVIRVGVKEVPEEEIIEEKIEEKAEEKKPEVPVGKAEKKAAEKKPEKKPEKKTEKKVQKEETAAKKNTPAKKKKPEKKQESRKVNIREYIPAVKTEEEVAAMKEEAKKFLDGVFAAMELPVEMEMSFDKEAGSLDITFNGDDMGILIGKRGQTLDSLQYLVSLVINKNHDDYVRVKLDTEDYRRRRKETLENLAKNIAYKVKRTRRPVSLEPMNPYERRIIHSSLQGNKYVETYSEGYEPYRHVVIALKK